MRLLITCQSLHSERIEQESQGRCKVVSVQDFNVDELHEYLRRCFGDEWPLIPETIWGPLRRPLLADLFRQIAAAPDWRPENEYELYAAFWNRLSSEAPLDGSLLERVVGESLEGGNYPWSGSQLANASVGNEVLKRHERAGWISLLPSVTGPQFEIAHDRLLNWVVAATLISRLRAEKETAESLGQWLRDFLSGRKSFGNRHMGFVAMDFLWMASHDPTITKQTPSVLAELEKHPIRTDILYSTLIPTLGKTIIEPLVVRLKQATRDGILSRRIADSIGIIGGPAAKDAALELAREVDPMLQRSAMRIFSHCPASDALDRLWSLHVTSQSSPDQYLREHESEHALYEESYGALRECCRLNPDWLNVAIQQSQPENEPTHTLAYLVAAVGGETGAQIWRQNKAVLREKVIRKKRRCLATCIRRFSDIDEIDWLIENVSNSTELIGPMAMSALAQIAPKAAVEQLESFPQKMLASTRKWYVNQLFVREPEAMRAKIFKMIHGSDDPWATAAIYGGFEHFLDAQTLNLLLDNLELRLEEALASDEWEREPMYSELQLLASLGTTHQLAVFNCRIDSRMEQLLTSLLLRIEPRPGLSRDSHIRDAAIDVLYRIGGSGFTTVVNSFLQSESQYGRLDTIELAGKRPDADTIRLLTEITQSDENWDGCYIEQYRAAKRLANLGEWIPVVNLVERLGLKALDGITDLVRNVGRPPIELSQKARDRIYSSVGDSPPGDVLLVGMGGQKSDAELVRHVLSHCPPDGELARASVISLELLADETEETVAILSKQLEHNEFSATNALIANGTMAALECLRKHFQGRINLAVFINLIKYSDDAREVIAEIRNAFETELRLRSGLDLSNVLDVLLSNVGSPHHVALILESEPIRTFIREVSFANEGPSWSPGSKASAIRCLAKFDAPAAFLAARAALRNVNWHDRDFYPSILVELDSDRAIPILFEQLGVEEDEKVVSAICGAMFVEGIDEILHGYLVSKDNKQRKVGCVAAGWIARSTQTETTLEELLGDSDEDVSRESANALSRIQRRAECRDLSEAIMYEHDRTRQWLLLDSLLTLADPGNIHQRWPNEGPNIGEVLSPLQFTHANKRLDTLREKLGR